ASVRLVMRLVVCLFAESRADLKFSGPVYERSYGVRTLYELLEEAVRNEGGSHVLMSRHSGWPRLMALFRLIHGGSGHPDLNSRAYGGLLFRPGPRTEQELAQERDAVLRALHILEHRITVRDSILHEVLRKLLRGPLPVIKGRART